MTTTSPNSFRFAGICRHVVYVRVRRALQLQVMLVVGEIQLRAIQ